MPSTMAQLQAPQGVHAEYASHTCPKLITAKPKASSLTLLDITFSNLDADANAEDAIIFRTKGNAMSLYACELVGGGDGEADQMVLGTFKRKAWSWRNRFVFTSGRKEKPEDKGSPVVVESTSGRWKNWQAIDVLYTDTLSGRSELGEQRDEVLARVGRKRRAFLKAHWRQPSELCDAETGQVLMTIDQRNTIGTAWSVGEPYTLTIAPHFDTVIAATCFLMYHYIVLQYKVGVV